MKDKVKAIERKIKQKYESMPVAIRATFWFVFCATLQKCVALITTPIFTRLLTTEQYGQFTAYNSWLSIFTMFTSFNLSSAVYNKGLSKYSDDKDGYMSSMLGTTSIITVGCFAIYLIFRNQINAITELSTEIMIMMFVEMLFFQSFSFWTVRQRYDFRYKSVVLVTLLMVFCNAGFGILAVELSTEKGLARIFSNVIVNTVFGVVIYFHIFKRGKKLFSWQYAKFAVLFNIPLIPHYLSTYILDQADRVMIQKMCGLSYVGIYGVAYSLGMVMKIITGSINQSLTPWQYRKLEEKDYDSINYSLIPIMLFVASLLVAFMAVAPEAMKILASKEYYDAIYIIPSVTASVFFLLMYNLFSNVEFYYDANKFTMFVSIIGALLNIVLNYIFIGLFGYIMAGYTTLFCYVVFTFAHFIYAQIVSKKRIGRTIFDWKPITFISAALIVVSCIFTLLYNTTVVRYTIFLIICLIIYRNRKKIIEYAAEFRRR